MMSHTLTDGSISLLTLPIKDTKSWAWEGDDIVSGFGVKLYTNGRRVFALRYRTLEGRHRMLTIGATGEYTAIEARQIARSCKHAVKRGGDPCEARDEEIVVIARTGRGAHGGSTRLYARLDGHPSLSDIAQTLEDAS